MLEVCIDSLESAINGINGGADELEVCSSLATGGLTPSAGLVKQILEMVQKLPQKPPINDALVKEPKINVMLRCREGWDFCYSQEEIDTMLADLEIFKQMGVDRFVFGALTDDQTVHSAHCSHIIAAADPIPVTFHRAFDILKEPRRSLESIIGLGFHRVLTSGQRSSAGHLEAIELIKTLVDSYGDKIEIMPGAGVTVDNAKTFVDLGCKIVHSSCKRTKMLRKVHNYLGNVDATDYVYVTDENIVRKLKETINS